MSNATTVTLSPIQAAALRQQAASREYRRHLIDHDCAELSWCQEREELDTAANIADHAYMRQRTV